MAGAEVKCAPGQGGQRWQQSPAQLWWSFVPQALQVWAMIWFISGLSRCGNGAADSSKISFQHLKKSMLPLWRNFLLLGKVGKGISGEESVAERDQWDPGTGGPQWGWESLRESGSVMFSCDGEVGERQQHKACEGWGNFQDDEAPLLLPMHNTHTGPAGTGWSHLQSCKKLFLPQPLLLTLCSSKAAGKGENGKRRENSCQRYQNGDSEWAKPIAVNPEPFWSHLREKLQQQLLRLDAQVVPLLRQISSARGSANIWCTCLETPSFLITQRRGLIPYTTCHAKPFASPKGQF